MEKSIKAGSVVGFGDLAVDFAGICAIARMVEQVDMGAPIQVQDLVSIDWAGSSMFVMPEAACGHGGGFVEIAAQNLEMLGSQALQMGASTCRARLHAKRGPGPCAILGRALSDSGQSWLILFVRA